MSEGVIKPTFCATEEMNDFYTKAKEHNAIVQPLLLAYMDKLRKVLGPQIDLVDMGHRAFTWKPATNSPGTLFQIAMIPASGVTFEKAFIETSRNYIDWGNQHFGILGAPPLQVTQEKIYYFGFFDRIKENPDIKMNFMLYFISKGKNDEDKAAHLKLVGDGSEDRLVKCCWAMKQKQDNAYVIFN